MYPLPLYYFLSQFWIPPLPLLPVTFLNDPYAMAVNDKSVRSTHYCLLCQRDHDPAKWRNRERTEATSLQIAIFNVRYVAITSDHNTRSYKQKKETSTHRKPNWKMTLTKAMRILWLVQQPKWNQVLYVQCTCQSETCTLWQRNRYTLSVIRQKGKSQNGCFKKTEHLKFSENRIFLTRWHVHIRVCIRR